MSAVDMLPCPFCGGTNITDESYWIASPVEWFGKFKCNDCDTDGPLSELKYDNRAEAVEDARAMWNRRAPVSAGKVKALVWAKKDGEFVWTAGAYTIRDDGDAYEVEFCGINLAFVGHDSCPLPLAAAERTAQEHHEARILSALIPGDGWRDGIRQLLAADQAFMDGTRLSDDNRALARHVAIASTYGSAAFLARMDDDQGTHAMMRAILTAFLDPLDPELDYLRADPSMGAKARAERAASQPQGNDGEGKA